MLILRPSLMNLPSGDLLAFMSANWTDTMTINYAGTDRTPSPRNHTVRPFHDSSVSHREPLSGSPESEGTWSRERSSIGPAIAASIPSTRDTPYSP